MEGAVEAPSFCDYNLTQLIEISSDFGSLEPTFQTVSQAELAQEKARDRHDGAHRAAAQAAGHVGGAVLGVGLLGPMEGGLAAAPRLAGAATLTSREIASTLAAAGGVGVGAQALSDALDRGRRRSTLGDYIGAAGGGVAGVAALPFGPARAGAVDGAVTSTLQDVLNGRPVSLHDAGESAVLGNLLGGVAGLAGRAASHALGKTAKGKLGEALGWTRSVADGKPRELGPKRMDPLTDDEKLVKRKGGHWHPDGRRGEKRFEDKFGTDAKLRPNQRIARTRLGPNFQLNHFLPADIGKIVGVPAAAIAPQTTKEHHRR